MAQRVNIVLEDDLDGSSADESVTFGLDGVTYEIDLSAKNAAKLRDTLAQYVGAARKVPGRASRRGSRRGSGPSASDVRNWARANGYDVSDRGRVAAEIRAAYEAAN
ncbi:MAG: Lsr2 family protein [Actinomycetota bacterium]|nr:Lsr2 family protein [Actinomycetota bacterium]